MHDLRGMECLHFDIVHQSVVLTMGEFKSMMFEVLTKEWVAIISWAYLSNHVDVQATIPGEKK